MASELDDNVGLSMSETGATISMSPLERRKSQYSELDLHAGKRHVELFQKLNQKFQTLDRFQNIPNTGSTMHTFVSSVSDPTLMMCLSSHLLSLPSRRS